MSMRIPKKLRATQRFNDGQVIPKGSIVYMVSNVKPWCQPATVEVLWEKGDFQFPCLCADLQDLE